jgi:hypothetical protein
MKRRNDSNFNVFISWSTEPARKIAELLKELLEKIFCVNPDIFFFVSSSEDGGIDVGARFRNILDDNLQKSDYGILILTKNNEMRPWLMFEAGALSKNIYSSRIVPILFTLKDGERKIESPIETFQHIKYSRDDFQKLIFGIFKNRFGKRRLSQEQKSTLKRLLEEKTNWDDFKEKVDKILGDPELEVKKMAKTADIFDNYFYNERSLQLKEFVSGLNKNTDQRIILFGGIATDIKENVSAFADWLQHGDTSRNDLYICYESKDVVRDRKEELTPTAYDGKDISEEAEQRKVIKVEVFIKQLKDTVPDNIKPHIHCTEISKRLSGYIIVYGINMYFTPVLHDRSSETFTYKLRDDQRNFIVDYMISKIDKSEDNEKLVSELNVIKLQINPQKSLLEIEKHDAKSEVLTEKIDSTKLSTNSKI